MEIMVIVAGEKIFFGKNEFDNFAILKFVIDYDFLVNGVLVFVAQEFRREPFGWLFVQ
jgi:hypothetical protein